MKRRQVNQRILILCEGYTEYYYAKALQMRLPRQVQRAVAIDIDLDSQHDPKSLVQKAKQKMTKARKEKNPYDCLWVFFDHDNWPQLREAFQIIEREHFQTAYSSICLEHWFILHFENCGKAFQHGEEAFTYLKRLGPEYHKTKLKHFDILTPRLSSAMERAKNLRRNSDPFLPVHQQNPYFTLDLLVEFFDELATG